MQLLIYSDFSYPISSTTSKNRYNAPMPNSKDNTMVFDFSQNTNAQILVKKISSSHLTPLLVQETLNATTLLESAYQETGKGRYSLLMLEVAFSLIFNKDQIFLSDKNWHLTPLSNILNTNMDYLDSLTFFQSLCPKKSSLKDSSLHSIPMPLGGMGYLGFEFFREIEKEALKNSPKKPKIVDTYDAAFLFGKEFFIFDHLYDYAYIVAINYAKEAHPRNLKNRIAKIEDALCSIKPQNTHEQNYSYQIISEDKKNSFIQMVYEIKKRLNRGDFLQCVPSQSLSIQSNLPPLQAYKTLRQNNPSPYMFYLDFHHFKILGTSPEVMLKIKNNELFLRPIAGTRKRGDTIAKDLELEQELRNDEKENAEHLMLIDLARNDIGKVAQINSIEAVKLYEIERYSRVMHIVSEIKGKLKKSSNIKKDAIYATFPAGTVSGAPKIEAIKTILELEPHSRGIYSGLIGYFDEDDFDSAIAIRTAIYQNNIYHLQAGAGIVADSNEELEFFETQNKMLALFEAITNKGF